jgi:hypothetical protein
VEYREHCSSEKLPFSDCGGEDYRKCGKRNGAKYQNNQCYHPSLCNKLKVFRCLNRKDIDEKVLAKSTIFHTADKRLDFFQYFNDHTDTHIICGDQALKKIACDVNNIYFMTSASVQCKKKDSDIGEKTFSDIAICKNSFFMKKMGYTEKEMNLPKKTFPRPDPISASQGQSFENFLSQLPHQYFALPGSCVEDPSRYFFCKKSQQCIEYSYGNTACGKFRGGVQNC